MIEKGRKVYPVVQLRVIQAQEGDCLLLTHERDGARTRLLIDGGPGGVFEAHLRPVLEEVASAGDSIDLAVLSHVDNDHVLGLRDLFVALRDQRDEGEAPLVRVRELWHNAFSETTMEGSVRARLQQLSLAAGPLGLSSVDGVLSGFSEGSVLAGLAHDIDVPLNSITGDRPILATAGVDAFAVGTVSVVVVGPTAANLDRLRAKWEAWIEEQEQLHAPLDRSPPNLSSLQLLVEADGRRMLLTGDGRGDHLLDALDELGLLDEGGGIHVHLLKLPHHGSSRNVTPEFFTRVTADTYVISANGKDDNPDRDTLEWLLAAAQAQQRTFTLVATNRTAHLDAFEASHPPETSGYTLRVLPAGAHFIDVDLTP